MRRLFHGMIYFEAWRDEYRKAKLFEAERVSRGMFHLRVQRYNVVFSLEYFNDKDFNG